MTKACGGLVSVPWSCQLISADISTDSVALDLVALEPCPGRPAAFPEFTPFTLLAGRPDGPPDRSWSATLTAWAAAADVVRMTAGSRETSVWLCLSAAEQHLVLEFIDDDR